MLISVICGVYNAESKIRRLMNSLISQTYMNLEIIMIINGTKDKTEEILFEYKQKDDRIILYSTPIKLGAGGARKKGMELASGEYLAVVDCDDYIEKEYIAHMVEKIGPKGKGDQQYRDDIIFSGFKRVSPNGCVKYVRSYKDPDSALYQSVAPWAKLYRKSFLEEKGIEFVNVPFGEDIIFTAEVIMASPKLSMVDYADYYWENNPTSTSHSEFRYFPNDNLNIVKNIFDQMIYSKKPEDEIAAYLIFKYMVWYLLQSGRNVGIGRMKVEYENAMEYLDKQYSCWEKLCYGFILRNKAERCLVRTVLWIVILLRRLKLSRLFFEVYSCLPMDRYWPSL